MCQIQVRVPSSKERRPTGTKGPTRPRQMTSRAREEQDQDSR